MASGARCTLITKPTRTASNCDPLSEDPPLYSVAWQQSDGSDEAARLFVFQTPAELQMLRQLTSGAPAYGLMSSSLPVDQDWMDEWLHDSIIWATKIDHSLFAFVSQHCNNSEQVRYSTSTIREAQQVMHFMCLLTRQANEEHWGLYIGFCGEHTAKACVQFIQEKFDPKKIVFDPEPFQRDLAPVIQVIATHMIRGISNPHSA